MHFICLMSLLVAVFNQSTSHILISGALQIRQIGPMYQQTQSVCPTCKGVGRSIDPSKRCTTCSGKGVSKERKILQIFIEKGRKTLEEGAFFKEWHCFFDVLLQLMPIACAGMSHHHKIYFRGEADEKPNEIPGDVIFVVEQQVSKHLCLVGRGTVQAGFPGAGRHTLGFAGRRFRSMRYSSDAGATYS